jgi:diaminopimelate epimerase
MTDVRAPDLVRVEGAFGTIETVFLDTGVPHAVVFVDDLEEQDVAGVGREIRMHDAFQPEGTNVDFVSRSSGPDIAVRTYERGVEDETLACGTGAVASAIAHGLANRITPPIAVRTRSGDILTISFDENSGGYVNVTMEGPVRKVFEGSYLPG